jgi:hypothetical protein
MAWNAKPPDLTEFRSYERYKADVSAKTEAFVRHLP